MPLVDFKEIPQANTGEGDQDTFELFGRDFFFCLGFQIEAGPNRGADGGKDLVIAEPLLGIISKKATRWLVSCKHYAHSGGSVLDADETDIPGRIEKFYCDGFIGFYSTLPSSGLANTLERLQDRFLIEVFDSARIEHYLVSEGRLRFVLQRHLPVSYKNITQSYTWEKFFDALTSLATGRSSIQERLINAYMYSLAMLRVDDLPAGLREEFVELEEALTHLDPVGDEGKIQATIWAMDEDTASDYAQKIVSLYDRYRVNLIDDLRR